MAVTMDGIGWAGSTVAIDLTGNNERLPSSVVGRHHWIIGLRTSDVPGTINNGDRIISTVPSNGIVATNLDAGGFVSQPTVPVTTNAMTVRLTRTVDMLRGTDRWIGPSSALVTSTAVLGLSIVDGGIATNRGIQDSTRNLILTLDETGGAVSSIDFRTLTTDGTTSGIAFYLDTGVVNDEWDAGDAAVVLASIAPTVFPPGGTTFTVTFGPPGLDVPNVNNGALDLFVVVRTANIATFDSFNLRINPYDMTVGGVLATQAGTVDAGLLTPLPLGATVVPSSDVIGDATPPRLRSLAWAEASPYLAAVGPDLYFNNLMPTPQFGDATGQARDDESGLLQASFSAEASLASSPAPMALAGAGVWRTWSGSYGFSSVSTDASTPAVVTVSDQVGNAISTTALGSDFGYRFTTQFILISPNPGWIVPGTPPFWLDPSGKLWFSPLVPGTMTPTLQVDLVSLFGGGLATASASMEPSLAGGPRPALQTYPPGTDTATFAVEFDVNAGSTDESSPARIAVFDNSGASASTDFAYGLDAEPPTISITAPAQGSTLSGTFTVRALVSDALTLVDVVEVGVDPGGAFQPMFFDGASYFVRISSALFPDGNHRIIVLAVDIVGNEHAVGIDVVFRNSAIDATAPAAAFVTPVQNAILSGIVVLQILATDDVAVARVDVRIGAAPFVSATFNPGTGRYEYSWQTTSVPDGPYRLDAIAVDTFGNQGAATPLDVKVDNTDPRASLSTPIAGQRIDGLFVFRVFASDAVGIERVTLEVFGSTVSIAFNSASGYYEYAVDTRSIPDGGYTARATVEDLAGRTTTTSVVAFEVRNTDYVRALLDVTPFLIFLVLLAAFLTGVLVLWKRRKKRMEPERSKEEL
ncbi:MAG: Ig-like domain-containing protein [Methanobacteriota archaeon]